MGNSAATACNWLFNTWISQASSIALANPSVGPRYFFVFMSTNYAMAAIVFFLYPETKGRTLEELGGALDDVPIDLERPKSEKAIADDLVPRAENAKTSTEE